MRFTNQSQITQLKSRKIKHVDHGDQAQTNCTINSSMCHTNSAKIAQPSGSEGKVVSTSVAGQELLPMGSMSDRLKFDFGSVWFSNEGLLDLDTNIHVYVLPVATSITIL